MRRPPVTIGSLGNVAVECTVQAAEKFNVLFVVSDDLCARLGCFGDPVVKSPNIDRLAARAVRFDRAYCQFPLCNPLDTIKLPILAANYREGVPEAAFLSSKKEQEDISDDLRRQAIQAYHAATSFMDAQVGLLLDALDRLKLADKTIVVFFSDHGYHLYEHGLWQKMSLFENSARVPLLISVPGNKSNGQACRRTVELVDLHPTLADLCGLTAPSHLDGKSLKPLLDNPLADWDKPALTQVSRGTPTATNDPSKKPSYMGRSIRTERYRLTEWDNIEKGTELYDHDSDPGELRNLAAEPAHAATVESLRKELRSRFRSTK